MPANKHCTHTNTGAHCDKVRSVFFSGMGPLHTRNHLARRLKMSRIAQRSRKQVSALRVGARGQDVKQTNAPRWEEKKGVCHSQRQEKRCIGDKWPDWQYAQTQATQGCWFFFLPFKQRYLSTSDTFLFSPSHFLKPDNWTLVTCFTRLWLVRAGERDSGQGTAAQRHTGKRVVYPIRDTAGMAGSLCDTFIANKIKIKASGIVGINPNEFPKRNEQNPKAQEMGFN